MHVITPSHNVDAFAGKFIDDILNTITAYTDAGADTIDALVTAIDSHFAPITWLARHRLNFDDPLLNFGNLLFKKSFDELLPGATENYLNATTLFPYFADGGSHSLIGRMGLTWNLFAARQ